MTSNEPPRDDGLNEVIFRTERVVVTYRLARLFALWWLSIGVLGGCFWIILDPHTTGMIDTVASGLMVTIVTAWITTVATGHTR